MTKRARSSCYERGDLAGEYRRFVSGHQCRTKVEREWIEVDCGYTDGPCWVWQGKRGSSGYGKKHLYHPENQIVQAHRHIFEQYHGPIPEGLFLDHLCRNRACVNPRHLEPVTNTVNIQRGNSATLTPDQVIEIRLLKGTMPPKEIAKLFGVSRAQATKILSGNSWKEAS